jgi:hypothetical protein
MTPEDYDYFLNLLGGLRNIGTPSYNEEFDFLWNLLNNYKKKGNLSLNERCDIFWSILDNYNADKIRPEKIPYMKMCQGFIRRHHEEMKNDPEHLTSSFLIKLTGCNCSRQRSN